MPADAVSVGIVIVTYNSRDEIGACLESVAGPHEGLSLAVAVVDNASTDGTPSYVRAHYPAVRVIESGANLGFARANNAGAADVPGEFLLFLNPDTVVPAGTLPVLLRALEARPNAAAAGPRLIDGDGRPELSFGPPISPWGEFRQKMILAMYNWRVPAAVRYVERRTATAGTRAWVSGACLLIRRRDWQDVGGFDPRFFMYTEDVDLCARLRARGRDIWFAPAAVVRHFRGRSAGRNPETERLRRLSHVAYYERHLPHLAWLLRLYLRVTGRGTHG